MITRGHFIGEIVDELSSIAHQVESRCMLGLTDLNVHLENFFRDILNMAMKINLINLNQERCNEPGLDLGDSFAKIAFQITSQNTSAKINFSLKKYSEWDSKPYDSIHILIIGKKQGSYTLEKTLCDSVGFSEKNIVDLNGYCKTIMDLPLDTLQNIYNYIKKEIVRVKIELEVPTADGTFSTNIATYIEAIPKPSFGDYKNYLKYQISVNKDYEDTIEDVEKNFKIFSKELSKLPRITREYLAFLLERRDDTRSAWHNYVRFNFNRMKRICNYPDIDGELQLLGDHGMLDLNEPDEPGESPYIRVFIRGTSDCFIAEFIDFVETNGIGYQKPIVSLDFSAF